ncbi:MAG TPA: hypothetical protein VHM19_14525 [Polyangiales bacterium]|nr:hypothetical protein [Polyangiales bacterium]
MGPAGPEEDAATSGETFDVCVVAWSDPGEHVVDLVERLFGVDRETASRLVNDVPMYVKRGVGFADAENIAQALQNLGARVVLERASSVPLPDPRHAPTPPPDQVARVAPPASLPRPPGPRRPSSVPLTPTASVAVRPPSQASVVAPPRSVAVAPVPLPPAQRSRVPTPTPGGSRVPRPRPISQDISVDLLGNDGGTARGSAVPKPARARTFDDTEDNTDSFKRGGLGRRGQRNLELDEGEASPRIDILPSALAATAKPASEPQRARSQLQSGGSAPSSGGNPSAPRASLTVDDPMGPRSAATGVEAVAARAPKPPPSPRAERTKRVGVALVRLLFSLAVIASGLWLDDSIVRGNASPPSLLLHAFAIYQLGLGLRGGLK